MSEKFTDNRAATFAWMIPHLTTVARNFGYAIGVHGSMSRDLDLIAVPWTDSAAPEETLVEAIRQAVDGVIRDDPATEGNRYDATTRNPSGKPHGRRAWSIHFAGHRFYIDLSVMPRVLTARQRPIPCLDEFVRVMKEEVVPEIVRVTQERQKLSIETQDIIVGGGEG